MTITAQDFIEKWRNVELKERSASQSHFNDLCRLLGVLDPVTADPKGTWFTFEKGASKSSGGEGWADVWRENCFAWEYKGKRKDLDAALAQLQQYALALDNPPLLIVSDMDEIRIHTNWTNTVHKTFKLKLADLADAANRDILLHALTDPERLKPEKTRQVLTEEAAQQFAGIAQRLRERGHEAEQVAHFVNRLVFCMFAEDVNLLPNKMFERMLKHCEQKATDFEINARTLFGAMQGGGMVGFEKVEWFNGGLFDDDHAFPLLKPDIEDLLKAAKLDWSDIDPSIMGTLFERGLDPDKRSQLGAHYTDREKIMMIVNPVIVEPLLAEWAEVRATITTLLDKAPKATKDKLLKGKELSASTKAKAAAEELHRDFLEKLKAFRVLDPACGSGNFLYLSLLELKNIEHRVNLEAEALGLPRGFPSIGPEAVLGIELNAYAAELARVSVWIGEIQWMRRNGFEAARNPILRTLNTIECRDAILNADGTRAEWPKADVVVGNPPFLGNKKMIGELGEGYTVALRKAWLELSGSVDLVVYWFAKAWEQSKSGNLSRTGLVSTNSIRSGSNREILKMIVQEGRIFHAWSDEEWTVDGAAVRVSLVCFDALVSSNAKLDGLTVDLILQDLTPLQAGVDITNVKQLPENKGVSFQGTLKVGAFDVSGSKAREWLSLPSNPNGKQNSDVLRPWANGSDVTGRSSDKWIIDFGTHMEMQNASLYEAPFEHVLKFVKPVRLKVRREGHRKNWWIFGEARVAMRRALNALPRYIVTCRVAKHRMFAWENRAVMPDGRLVVVGRSDDTSFGLLHSKFHEIWSLALGGWHGVGNDPQYTPSLGFETFPFPEGLTPNIAASDYAADPRAVTIAAAAARLNELRENWLNPPDLVKRVAEVVPGYPDRILPVDEMAEAILKKRTLTNLYNQRPAWLDNAHATLDEAVAEAYGWGDDWRAGKLVEDEILSRLFQLNQTRAKKQD
jgi:type II restriction/modification system DNA methylase subunit YeeA